MILSKKLLATYISFVLAVPALSWANYNMSLCNHSKHTVYVASNSWGYFQLDGSIPAVSSGIKKINLAKSFIQSGQCIAINVPIIQNLPFNQSATTSYQHNKIITNRPVQQICITGRLSFKDYRQANQLIFPLLYSSWD